MYEFVDGIKILDFISQSPKSEILKIIKDIFKQLHTLDRLNINKAEMHHPIKHILVGNKTVLIDFERCRYTEKPQNVTGFCQFMIQIKNMLKEKNIITEISAVLVGKEYNLDFGEILQKIQKKNFY